MTEYNVQQKQFIQEYKASHHLENKSDEQIMLFIQKDMQTNGVVYSGFENLVKPQNKPAYTGQIFGNSTTSNDMAGAAIEHGSSATAVKEPEKGIITDENGNEVAIVKNGDEIVEATLSQTDSNGNKLETVVSYENGKPVKQIKKQNGNVSSVTKFKYNEPTENMPFQSVTVETIDGGKNKIITTALETDEYGNVDQEDFISRKTISRDGTETTVIIGSECIKEDKVKIDGKKVSTLYNGTNLADFDNHKLHRIAQETEIDGVKRYAEYDGKGNTKTTVQNGESPALIAQKFNVKEQALMRLNPQKGKNAITQVGADILIPGEFNADSYPMRVRKSKGESLNKYNQFETRRLAKEINSGEVENVKLSKTYNNVYELAKDNLIKSGVKNPSNQQVNDEANKLILLNGKNVNLKAGASVKVAKSLTNSKQASELTKYGFQASAENRIFFKKFSALNPQQKQNVLSAIQYCKSQKITNPSDIKAKVLETLGINLFDSDKTVPMVADNNYGVMAYQRNSKPISIETFVKDHLKLDIKSEPGKTVLERLSQVEQTKLNKISAKDFKGFNNKTLDSVASMLETVGVQIRTQAEINVKNNTPRAKAEKEKRAVRTAAAENIALAYDNAINVIKNYQGNQGWMNIGFYREKLGQLLDKVNPTDVATCFDAVIKQLEKEKQFAVSRLKTASANESEFKQAFKNLTGKDYNENAVKNFLAQAQKGGDWSKSYDQAFGDKLVKRATDKVNFQQYVDGAGDIVLMLLGTEAIGKGVAWAGGKVATKLSPYVPKVLSKLGAKGIMTIGNSTVTVGKVVGNMATSAATFTAWDATKNYINLKTKDIQYTGEDAVKEWQAYKEGNVESGKFGVFAGLLNSTVVGKVVNGTMKIFEKPVAKAMQGVATTLEKGEATGADVMKTFMAKQTPGMLAKTAGIVAEVSGFTMYETANNLTKKLLQTDANGQLHLPKDLTEEGLTQYLLKNIPEEFLKQAKGIGEIKAISKLIFMHKGAVAERERMMNENLSKCEMLGKVKIQKAEVEGAEVYAITTPNGNRKIARSPEDVVAYCNVLMQMDMAMNSKVMAEEAKPNEKQTGQTGLSSKFDTNKVNESKKNNKSEGFSLKDLHVITSKDLQKKFNNNSELNKNKWWQENFESVLTKTEGKLFAHSKMEQLKKPIDQKKANYARKLLLEKIIDDPELCNNPIIQEFLIPSDRENNGLEYIRSIEQCQNTYSMMKKVVSDSRLQSMKNVGQLFNWLNDDRYDFQNAIIDKILGDEKLSKNDDFIKDFIQTVGCVDNTNLKVKKASYLKILDKVTSDKDLYKNKSVMKSLNRILLLNSQEESAKNVVEFFDSVLKNPLLAENTSIKMVLGDLAVENQKEILQLLNTICNNEEYKNNKNLMQQLGDVARHVIFKRDAEYMTKMLETLYSKQEYKENSSIINWTFKIIESSNDENNLNNKTKMLETLFSKKEYKNNASLMEWTGKIVAECKTPEEVQAKEKMLKVLFSKKYKNNEKLMEQLGDIIHSCKTPTDVTTKQSVLDLCLTDKKLTENPNVQECLGYILRNSKEDNKVLNLVNKYLEEPLLNENESVQMYAGYIIGGAENEYMKNIMDKYLAEPKLNQNSNLQSMIGKIFVFTSKKEVFESRIGIIDKYLTTPELFNDSSVQNELGNIIARCRTKQQLESSLEFIDTYMADKKAFEEKYGKDNFGKIISVYSADNAQLLEQSTKTPNLNKDKISNILKSSYIEDLGDDAGGNAGHIDDAKVQRFMNLLQNPKISPFIVKLLNEDVDMDTACFLAKTKQGYYQNKQENNNPYISKNSNYSASQIEFANTLGARGMKKGEIEAILKVVSNNGEVDIKLKTCTLMLLNNEVPHNEVLNMLKSYFIDEAPKKVRQTSTPTTVVGGRTRESIKGLERKIIDQYQPNENVWRSKYETKKWAEEKYQAMKSGEYISTRNTPEDPHYGEKISQQRAEMLNKWYEFMETDGDIKDNPFAKITILRAITEDLLPENSKTAVEFDRAIAKKIIAEAMNDVDKVSFRKAYNNALKSQSQRGDKGEKIDFDGVRGTMFTVPQTDSSSPDFATNVAKVKAYSDGTNWCIRSWNAAPYIQQGAMHFFVDEHGLTQVCIRENSPSNVAEIQKRQQDKTRPIPYVTAIKDFMDRHEIKYPDNYLDEALAAKPAFDKLKNELQTYVAKKDYKGILEKLGITVEVKPDGTWELSHYKAQVDNFTLNDLGINENELLANVSSIKGDADFANSNATSLPKLQYVHGQFKFIGSSLSDIRSLKEINGYTINWE